MTTAFHESDHPRVGNGQFTEKQYAEAPTGVVAAPPKPEDFHQDFADAVKYADRAANGDSNDDEHDALVDLTAAAEGYLEAHRKAGTLDLDTPSVSRSGFTGPSFHAALKRMVSRSEEVFDGDSNDDEFDHLHNFKELVRAEFNLPEYDEDDED
ncbi:hypothetical protein [Curtobacterium sp. MCBD17_040]|uniref:hypothetical protein n=1 Tax=Curtobacterium sp. MCBD17_040 TaxID=2175674 RepID=UPI000DA8E3EB|nr:hypothetical protein [Curtobacterium sp. MCBD17_040]WIB65298.1 hypothetical protein DEI94_17995 [Curtobacterium sp. MCBD17_040]